MGNNKIKYGILLVHGLLDGPFSLKEIGYYLQEHGILSRAILLPGHGTNPADLLTVKEDDWLKAVSYGIESLRNEVEEIYLIGFSTGATLSLYQALQKNNIKGLVLLSPAITLKLSTDIFVNWCFLLKWLGISNDEWGIQAPEDDYTKYQSVGFNPITQLSKLTSRLDQLRRKEILQTPMRVILSREDETISSKRALKLFSQIKNKDNRLLLYTNLRENYPDPRIEIRSSQYPDLHIKHFSHMCLPFSANNPHYGRHGDYAFASHTDEKGYVFGSYNIMELSIYEALHKIGLLKQSYQELTYNPDFKYMADYIVGFIMGR